MSTHNRRDFLTNAARVGVLAGLGDFAFLRGLPPLSAQEVRVQPNRVQLSPDIEPLVRMLEETPRERLIEETARRVRAGTTYQELLAALLLAGVRTIRPRPVGFQFHAVLVTNSAHLASIAAHDRDRWLPLFWAVDNFKASQARHLQATDWVMPPVNESRLPAAAHARRRFIEAMDNWDEEGADLAITSLVRSAGASEVIELFWRYGSRDFRDIGHKAIYAANAWRTLQTIGWRHAEPVMRSLAFAQLDHGATPNPARRDEEADRPWRDNLQRVTRIRREWRRGRTSPEAASDLLAALRTCTPAEGSERVVTMLNQGIDPACVWDGLFLTAGELLMRQPGIVGLHCVTTVNAMHYAYQTSENDETRQMVTLQAAAFLPMFRRAMLGRGQVRDDVRLDRLEAADTRARGPQLIEEICADIPRNRLSAARKTLALIQRDRAGAPALMAAARRLIFTKGRDSHDYKFSSAALEDFYHTTPAWRNRFLASSVFWLKGSSEGDNELIRRARTALGNT